MTTDHIQLDRRRLNRLQQAAPLPQHPAAFLHREVGRRLLEHLEALRITPSWILDASTVTGSCLDSICEKASGARVIALDPAATALTAGRRRWRMFDPRRYLSATPERLPLTDQSMGLVISNLALHRYPEPDEALAEFLRVLEPGGVLKLATVGPDTLRELRSSWATSDSHVHVHAFLDMHDLGDALSRIGFTDIVVSAETLTTHAPDLDAIHADLRALCETCAAAHRNRSLTTPGQLRRVASAYEQHRVPEGLPVTVEVVYVQAWRPQPRSVSVSFPIR